MAPKDTAETAGTTSTKGQNSATKAEMKAFVDEIEGYEREIAENLAEHKKFKDARKSDIQDTIDRAKGRGILKKSMRSVITDRKGITRIDNRRKGLKEPERNQRDEIHMACQTQLEMPWAPPAKK